MLAGTLGCIAISPRFQHKVDGINAFARRFAHAQKHLRQAQNAQPQDKHTPQRFLGKHGRPLAGAHWPRMGHFGCNILAIRS